jgi:putative membrane protein
MRLDKTATAALVAMALGGAMATVEIAEPAQAAAERSNISAADRKFLADTFNINQGEIMLGRLAEKRATARPVRAFARRMITDHTKALDASRRVASTVHAKLPDAVDVPTKAVYDDLSRRSGRDFDTAYLDAMVSGHEEAIRKFEQEVNSGQNAAIKDYARTQLPTLKEHLDHARNAQQEVQTGVAEPQKP